MSICWPSPVRARAVGEGDADFLRFARGIAGQVHDAAHALDHEIVAGSGRIGSVLAEAGNGAIDQLRIDRLQALVVEAVFLQAADLEVLDQHVGFAGEVEHQRPALVRGEISSHRALSPVAGKKIGSRLLARALDPRRTPFAGIVALRAFDFDHIRTEISERLAAPGAGENAGELKHLDAGERTARGHFSAHDGDLAIWMKGMMANRIWPMRPARRAGERSPR
jgi:hypothetical protein